MKLKKNDIISLEITGITSEGSGVGRYDGLAVFVPGTAQGDFIEALIIKVKSNYAIGKLNKLINPAKQRIEVNCTAFPSCGGCVYRHISYESELDIKYNRVKDCMERIGNFQNLKINPVISAAADRYRNKSQIPIGTDKNGRIISGFYSHHSHRIIKCDSCYLHDDIFSRITEIFLKWANTYKLSAYDEKNRTGLLRHLYIRFGEVSREIMVCIVINGKKLEHEKELVTALVDGIKNIVSIIVNINTQDTNVIMGKESRVIYGKGYIYDELCSLKFKLSPNSFYQVNRTQAERLYDKAIEYASLSGHETVVDLYCGIGTIGLSCAKNAKRIIGVEIVPQAIEDAKENARLNNINNAEFFCADATQAAEMLKQRGETPDVVIIDPPRKGCDSKLIDTIVQMSPSRIVYISCDVATQARDLKLFNELGYSPVELTPVNMFPRTAHVETVALLSKK